jgi:hypothetical protein
LTAANIEVDSVPVAQASLVGGKVQVKVGDATVIFAIEGTPKCELVKK